MRIKTSLQGCLTAASILVACGGSEPPKPAPTPPQAAATAAPPAGAPAAGGSELDVPECDDYIKAYEECVQSKVPEAARAQLRTALEQSRQAWRQAASSSEGRASLGVACKQARDAARLSMQAYGCAF